MKNKGKVIGAGLLIGIAAVILVYQGNPANMGFCIACFIRDTAGAVGIHRADTVQYIRPEIIGLILGAFILSFVRKEFQPKGGSSPMTRFVLGFFVMIGALMFLGCPLRMVLRIGGGDWNAILGLVGFVIGIVIGVVFLKRGYSLRRTYTLPMIEGLALPITQVILLVLVMAAPAFIFFSESGPGSMRAPIFLTLIVGLVVGMAAQYTRLCMAGGIRDVLLFKDWTLLAGFIAIFVGALVLNMIFGFFHPGFAEQPVAHTDGLWNMIGMVSVGFGSVLLGGCPMRQLILAGEGNTDSAITVVGLFVGGAFAHNFGLASSPKGPTANGQIAVIIGIIVMAVIAVMNTKKSAA